MTQKEKLYKELILITNKINRLKNKKLLDESDEYFSSDKFAYEARSKKIEEWKDDIRWQKKAYESVLKKVKVEQYFSTEGGKKVKNVLGAKRNALFNERKAVVIELNKKLSSFIKSWLGNDWGIGVADKYNVEIGLIKEVVDGYTHFLFEHRCTLTYGNDWDGQRKLFNLNYYGSIENLELLGDDDKCSTFIFGLGKFVSDKQKLTELRSMLWNYVDKLKKFDNQIWDLGRKIENPLEEKAQ